MNEEQEFAFASNSITTSKYTLWNFAPLFLFSSFQCVASLSFSVCVCISRVMCVCVCTGTEGVRVGKCVALTATYRRSGKR